MSKFGNVRSAPPDLTPTSPARDGRILSFTTQLLGNSALTMLVWHSRPRLFLEMIIYSMTILVCPMPYFAMIAVSNCVTLGSKMSQ
jgi:hypothetical protein